MADIIVNNWNKKGQLEKDIFIELLKAQGMMKYGDTVVAGVPSEESVWSKKICKIACAAAESAAVSACAGNPGCIAAAIIAGELCKKRCK
jgi:hypothetical protein